MGATLSSLLPGLDSSRVAAFDVFSMSFLLLFDGSSCPVFTALFLLGFSLRAGLG